MNCKYREIDGTCGILSVSSTLLEAPVSGKPNCTHLKKNEQTCDVALSWNRVSIPDNPYTFNPVDAGFLPPMGEL